MYDSFTRTFMELKLYTDSQIFEAFNVLLVPLWNWNYFEHEDH